MADTLKFKTLKMSGATTTRCKRYKADPLYYYRSGNQTS